MTYVPWGEIINWRAIYWASLIFFVGGIIFNFINPLFSVISFIFIIALWTEIPGLINPYLVEANMGDFFVVLLALQYGGIPIAILVIPYIIFTICVSKMRTPSEGIPLMFAIVTATILTPFVHSYITNGNILHTLYVYSIILYGILFLLSIMMPAKLFETVRYIVILIPMAWITNTFYFKMFGNFTQRFLKGSISFDVSTILFIGLLLGGATFLKFLYSSSKNVEIKKSKPESKG